jgi:hypothetical protein
MKLGTENKKSVYALVGLGVFAAYMVYSQLLSGPTYKTVTVPQQTASTDAPADVAQPAASKGAGSGPNITQSKSRVGKGSSRSSSKNGEFHPVYQQKKPEDRPNVETIDPTIRFDLLAKIMKIPAAGGERDLFQMLKSPPVKTELARAEPIVKPYVFVGPRQPLPPPLPRTEVKTEAPPTPIPFKFYGVSTVHPDGTRTAYFIMPGTDNTDEILRANEGDVLKGRFRIVNISIDKVLVEDTQDKRRQPLNMEKEVTQ